jgi:hypothetical protein
MNESFFFQTEEEYAAFRLWAQEGSTIEQRMNAVEGGIAPKIPSFWYDMKPSVNKMPATLKELNIQLSSNWYSPHEPSQTL